MLKVNFSKQAVKFLGKLGKKQSVQIAQTISELALSNNEVPNIELKGYKPFRRVKSGEYRIVYFLEKATLYITLIAKRNDDEIYKLVKRLLN